MRSVAVLSLLVLGACSGDEKPKVEEKKAETPPAPEPATPVNFTITNNCSMDVWMAFTPNAGSDPLPDGIVKITASGGSHGYSVPTTGWAGRLWPKMGCDSTGENCTQGQTVPPCPSVGCQPAADTLVEFYFDKAGGTGRPYYDISLVEGFSVPMSVTPSGSGGRCTSTSCALDLTKCPTAENEKIGDLQIKSGSDVVGCFSPCNKWTWPKPLGDGGTTKDATGQAMCCPNPPITSPQCNAGSVAQTQYVALVHSECPTAYAFSFDDAGGSHDCDPRTAFSVTLCP